MGTKMIKDPVHGYIKIRDDYMKQVIDSCEFQRLRNIRQTSYDSLYPGSSHSRFIHSLGVFYLGMKAFRAFKCNVNEQRTMKGKIDEDTWDSLQHTFELACLLHDVGHTPFSHTGEDFLLIEKDDDKYEIMKGKRSQSKKIEIRALYNQLLDVIKVHTTKNDFEVFLEDFAQTIEGSTYHESGKNVAKPHEIMSVIVAANTYQECFKQEHVDFELFARMILGLCYKEDKTIKTGTRNALIQMLNSSIIDVDRLDYIIRDTQMSGFDSTSIDVERLLESVTLLYDNERGVYKFGYKKNALSTIVNVVLAHDAERRWIQGHPIVMFDSFLIKQCIKAVEQKFKEAGTNKSIFQQNSFSVKGIQLNGGLNFRLMNDGDFIFLMKQIQSGDLMSNYVDEYLARDKRRRPIWKSEAEFRLLMGELTTAQQKILLNTFAAEGEINEENSIGNVLNETRLNELQAEIESMNHDPHSSNEDLQHVIANRKRQVFWLKRLENFCVQNDIEFEIYNKKADVFRSKVNSLSDLGVEIWYDQFQRSESIKDVLELYNTKEEPQKREGSAVLNRMFYLYIKKNDNFSMKKFVDFLKETLTEYESKQF